MSGQGRSTASSRSYPWSPRLTVSGGGQSQYSAYTIYSDVESDHNVFAFIPPPTGGAELPVQPQLPEPLPVLEEDPRPTTAFRFPTSEPHRRQALPSFGQFVRRFTASDTSGTRPATQNTSEERLHPPPSTSGSARGTSASSGGSDTFNYAHPQRNDVAEHPGLVALNEASVGFGGDPSVPPRTDEKGLDLRFEIDSQLDYAEEDSPFPEVRASVSNIDDPSIPVNTFRVWFLGFILILAATAANCYFMFRYPSTEFTPQILVLLAHPMGKICAMVLPYTTYKLPGWLGGLTFSFNPGPWNVKEHTLLYILASIASIPPYITHMFVVQEKYYGVKNGIWYEILMVLSCDVTGFGMAGFCRELTVKPASMLWPQNLVTCTLMNTLHAEEEEETGGTSRPRFFSYILLGSFVFYFFPGFIFTALSMFSWVCWIWPENVTVNQLFGVSSGLGMGLLTFDWGQISWAGSPLMTPWWTHANVFASFVVIQWIVVPIVYYTNTWNFAHFPISGDGAFDKFGQPYDVSRILTPQHTLNATAYEEYSPLYLPVRFAFVYLLAFAMLTSVLVHAALHHGGTIYNALLGREGEEDDIHLKLMQAYPEVPGWIYAALGTAAFSLSIIATQVWDTGTPFWVTMLAVLLPVIYILPTTFLYANTGVAPPLNLIAQIIPGLVAPGDVMTNMLFKVFAIQPMGTGMQFTQDLKLAHYMKIPPRTTFWAQLFAVTVTAFLKVGVRYFLFERFPDICTPDQPQQLVCPVAPVFFTSSVIWGAIGPVRQFGSGALYHPMLYAMIFGALIPIPFWLMARRRPRSFASKIFTPVWFANSFNSPPATGINASSSFLVGFIFQYIVRRKNFFWWAKFNYVTSAGLDAGTGFAIIIMFFAFALPKHGEISIDWWGNRVWMETADFAGVPLIPGPISS